MFPKKEIIAKHPWFVNLPRFVKELLTMVITSIHYSPKKLSLLTLIQGIPNNQYY